MVFSLQIIIRQGLSVKILSFNVNPLTHVNLTGFIDFSLPSPSLSILYSFAH